MYEIITKQLDCSNAKIERFPFDFARKERMIKLKEATYTQMKNG